MRVEKPASIVSAYAYRPLEVAVETARRNLMEWLIAEFGFSSWPGERPPGGGSTPHPRLRERWPYHP